MTIQVEGSVREMASDRRLVNVSVSNGEHVVFGRMRMGATPWSYRRAGIGSFS